MCAIEKSYAVLERLLDEEKIYMDPSLDFASICRAIGVERTAMDSLLMVELGLDGATLLSSFRAGAWSKIRRKYGINAFF